MLFSAGITGVLAVIILWFWRWRDDLQKESSQATPTSLDPEIQGLTEVEAQARLHEDQDNPTRSEPAFPIKEIVRANVFTVFNLSLFGVAIAQFLLARPWDALLSLLVALLNIGINIGQELFVEKRLKGVKESTRPQAIVLRDGKTRGIDPTEIVRGDVLFVGPGDQFLAGGELLSEKPVLVDQSLITHENSCQMKEQGDLVDAGSYCVSSHAAYRVENVGANRLIAMKTEDRDDGPMPITTLEKIINRIMQVLLGIVVIMILMLVARYFQVAETMGVDTDKVINAVNVIFSLAPASLYFMVFLTYAVSTAKIVKYGALVRQARSVEALAEVTDLCITQAGIQRDTTINLQPFPSSEEHPQLDETHLRQILGNFAHSSSSKEWAIVAMREAFPGEQREVVAEAPYLSAYRWTAISFNDKDVRGVFVLGEPEMIQGHLTDLDGQRTNQEKEGKPDQSALLRGLHSFGNFFSRGKSHETEQAHEQDQGAQDSEPVEPNQPEIKKGGGLRSWFGHLRDSFLRENGTKKQPGDDREDQDQTVTKIEYMVAYVPDLVPLFNESGYPQLPEGLIPLATLHFSSQAHPETIETLQALAATGINIRIFASGSADPILPLVEKAGLNGGEASQQRVISSSQLMDEDADTFIESIKGKTIFSEATPEISRQVVEALQAQNGSTVVVGDGPGDLHAMKQAALTVAWQSSSQAALGAADIVLLENSLKPLLQVLEQGQCCVNGLIDILKLYLTRLFYLFLLILVFWWGGLGIPYQSSQGAFIALVTLSIPSVVLSLWAAVGVIESDQIGRRLNRFILPAALTICAAAFLIYRFFLDRSGDIAYAQLALTHFLVFSGLVMVILVRPPLHFLDEEEDKSTDWRLIVLVLVLFVLYMLFTMLPLADTLFNLSHLQPAAEYLIIVAAVLGWVLVFLMFSRLLSGESLFQSSPRT